jgi:hypothetical protein
VLAVSGWTWVSLVAGSVLLMCLGFSLASASGVGSLPYVEMFDGQPGTPLAWQPRNWDVTVHSRDSETWQALEPMTAHHGHDCSPPLATHPVSVHEDAVFVCRDHLMTALNATGYGVIYLTPDHLVDFSRGEALVQFDISLDRPLDLTLRLAPSIAAGGLVAGSQRPAIRCRAH